MEKMYMEKSIPDGKLISLGNPPSLEVSPTDFGGDLLLGINPTTENNTVTRSLPLNFENRSNPKEENIKQA